MQLLNKNTLSTFFTRTERMVNPHFPPVTVLAYHAVSDDKTIVDIDPYTFQKQLDILESFCEFITLDQVIDFICGKIKFMRPAVALSFDDAYADVMVNILPILARKHIPAAVFALSDPDNANRKELENNKQLMTTKQLQALHDIGWTVGCHSATHADFANNNLDRDKEIINAKKQLENALGFPVSYFVYPKGTYSPSIVETVKSSGYIAAFAFEAGFINERTNLFAVPRIPVDWTHTEEQFRAFFTNWGIWYLQTKQKLHLT